LLRRARQSARVADTVHVNRSASITTAKIARMTTRMICLFVPLYGGAGGQSLRDRDKQLRFRTTRSRSLRWPRLTARLQQQSPWCDGAGNPAALTARGRAVKYSRPCGDGGEGAMIYGVLRLCLKAAAELCGYAKSRPIKRAYASRG
jgi:hypothetical protein